MAVPPDGHPESSDPVGTPGAAARTLPPELDPRRGQPAPDAPAEPRRKRSKKRILAWVAGGLALLLVLLIGTGWLTLDRFAAAIKKIDVFGLLHDRPSGGVVGDLNILVVGSDSRQGLTPQQQHDLHVGHDPGQRSDTMILVHIPRGGGKAVLVSLPRDSYVTIPAHKDGSGHQVPAQRNKLNAAYAEGGGPLTVATVEANTHVRIDHYIEINFLGFVKIVDALGGVTVCTPTPIHDPVVTTAEGTHGSGLDLPAGRSHINGATALEYVRARYFDPSADLGRIQRQQRFISGLVQRAESTGVLLNPIRIYHVLDAVASSLVTDKDFGVAQIKRLVLALRSMDPSHIQLMRVPLLPGNMNTAVGNVVEWDPAKAKRLFTALTEDQPVTGPSKAPKVTIAPGNIALEVLNATGRQGAASHAASQLAAVGFIIRDTGNAPAGSDPGHTIVQYGPSRADSAHTVAAAVPGATTQQVASLGSGLRLIVGTNYHGAQHVTVVNPGDSASKVRTAADDVCT